MTCNFCRYGLDYVYRRQIYDCGKPIGGVIIFVNLKEHQGQSGVHTHTEPI